MLKFAVSLQSSLVAGRELCHSLAFLNNEQGNHRRPFKPIPTVARGLAFVHSSLSKTVASFFRNEK